MEARLLTVNLPPEYEPLAEMIEEISIKKEQSISRTIRDMLCEVVNFTPVLERNVKKRNMYKNKTKKA